MPSIAGRNRTGNFQRRPSERDFYETYLPQFEAAVREGHVGAVMGAYNSRLGKPACANPLLLTDLLRKQWGFDGHVVSDCGAIYDIWANHQFSATPEEAAAAAVKAGDDLCCGDGLQSAGARGQKGLITEEEIDTALGRVLAARFRLGLVRSAGQGSVRANRAGTKRHARARSPGLKNGARIHGAVEK